MDKLNELMHDIVEVKQGAEERSKISAEQKSIWGTS